MSKPTKPVPVLHLPQKEPDMVQRHTGGRGSARSSRKFMLQNRTPEQCLKLHKFRKVPFSSPTWCVWSNTFIWGLDKTGFQCLGIFLKFIAEAKLTVCEGMPTYITVQSARGENSTRPSVGVKLFTVHLPEGQRRSVMFNPMQKLSEVVSRICRDRDWNVSDYVACDSNGNEIDLRTLIGQIRCFEITFTKREGGSSMARPMLISEVKAKLESEGLLNKQGSQGLSARIANPPRKLSADDVTKTTGSTSTEETSSRLSPRARLEQMRVTERYQFRQDKDKEMGTGAFSTVYSATEKATGDVVAIKVIERADDPEQAEKFRQEFEIHAQLLHDHIIQFIMMDETPDKYFVVMELCSGGELFDLVIARGQIDEQTCATLICQILTGLAYMHKKGYVHRDLKPENLLFQDKSYSVLKIADFGESKLADGNVLTTYCGTPDYMAPEIIQAKKYGSPVDMWALGCISYIMMAGFPPFDGESDAEILSSIIAVRYDFPTPEWDDYSDKSQNFVSGLLIFDPAKRMTSQEALDHKWIVSSCSESQRNIPGRQPEERSGSAPRRHRDNSAHVSPRIFDPLELSVLQSPFNESDELAKSQLLNAVSILIRFANSKSIHFVSEELVTIQSLVFPIPDPVRKRSEYHLQVLKTYWTRLQSIKTFLLTRKDPTQKLSSPKKKKMSVSK